jgi:hypothetical protein
MNAVILHNPRSFEMLSCIDLFFKVKYMVEYSLLFVSIMQIYLGLGVVTVFS